jgi:putative oxidoreductase
MLERTVVGRWHHAVPVIVRVIVGFTFLMYGYQKVFQRGLEDLTHFFRTQGFPLPGVFAFVASYLELLGGLALIVGFQVRWLALLFCIQMLVALFTTHLKHGFFYGPPDKYGISNVLNLFGYSLMLLILGAGPWSMDALRGRER